MKDININFDLGMALLRKLNKDDYDSILNLIKAAKVNSIGKIKTDTTDERIVGVLRVYTSKFGSVDFDEALKIALNKSA